MNPDCIVIGTGGVGSAALYQLARRGLRVLGLDRFSPPHDRGSSHGETRLIRLAYFEHPDYVPLLRRAYHLWHELEQETGRSLYLESGLLQVGPENGPVVSGVLESARRHHLSVEFLSRAEAERRFQAFKVPEGSVALLERQAGLLPVEDCVRLHLELARQLGAEIHSDEEVTGWHRKGTGFEVRTADNSYRCENLVVTAGAWASRILGNFGVRLEVLRKPLFWYATRSKKLNLKDSCPAFLYELLEGKFYGFPSLDGISFKTAEHSGGTPVANPLEVDRSLLPHEDSRVRKFLKGFLPAADTELLRHQVCLYTMSPDGHFVLDRHPEYSGVVYAAGLSGHGFKFATVLGEVLAQWTAGEQPELPLDFLSSRRPGLLAPS